MKLDFNLLKTYENANRKIPIDELTLIKLELEEMHKDRIQLLENSSYYFTICYLIKEINKSSCLYGYCTVNKYKGKY